MRRLSWRKRLDDRGELECQRIKSVGYRWQEYEEYEENEDDDSVSHWHDGGIADDNRDCISRTNSSSGTLCIDRPGVYPSLSVLAS